MSFTHILIVVGIILLIALIIYIVYRIKKDIKYIGELRQLDIRKMGYTEMPAVPFSIPDTLETVVQLGLRTEECKMAKYGLSKEYSLPVGRHSAYTFMYDEQSHDTSKAEREQLTKELEALTEEELFQDGKLEEMLKNQIPVRGKRDENDLTQQFLQEPKQFTMGWTHYYDVYQKAKHKIKDYSAIMKDADKATEQFWPMIAENGLAYNLLFLKKVDKQLMDEIRENFGTDDEVQHLESIHNNKLLYSIDLRIFEKWGPEQVKGHDRWTPGSWILLEQDPKDKSLKPISVRISGHTVTKEAKVYHRNPMYESVWLFALTAARCSVTVYGIWLGHVYHWHIVTAAMQMTMFQNIKEDHAVRKLLDPQSKSLIGFNDTLFLLWTQIGLFDDDPLVALGKLGITPDDFTHESAWDQYPIVKDLLHFWKISHEFAKTFTDITYKTNKEVAEDQALKDWILASKDPEKGNIRGLEVPTTREELTRILASLIYRVVVHGNSRQMASLDAALCFVSNYPPCLQKTVLPDNDSKLSLGDLLTYLPNTGTIGEMMTFYYIFTYSAPKDQLLPLYGNDTSLYFDDPNDARNAALVTFRNGVEKFLNEYKGGNNLKHQWPSSIET